MAEIAATISTFSTFGDEGNIITWATMANGDTGSPIEMPGRTFRSIHVRGTFGSGGTIVIEGSNDGTNYVTLADLQGNTISKTAEAIESIQEVTRYLRPRVSGGDGTTSLNAYLCIMRGR